MKTRIFSIQEIDKAAELLQRGELIAFPTETVYGLGAPIFNEKAVQQIFQVKGRPQDNPLIAHIAELKDVERLAVEIPHLFYPLASVFFPGPLTVVLKRHPQVPSIVSAGQDTIAIRMPEHPIARALIKSVGEPLVAPSANLSGRPSSTTAAHVLHDFNGKIAGIVEGGECSYGLESTVVDLVSFERPTILRPGKITKEQLEAVIGEVDFYTKGPKSSPGMRYRHYSPNIPVRGFFKREELLLSSEIKQCILSNKELDVPYYPLEPKTLYAYLRFAEESGYDEVVILCEGCEDRALLNRLEKILELTAGVP